MSQKAEELVRSGQPRNLIKACILTWEITTVAGILMIILMESGASPLTQMSNGSTALSLYVRHQPVLRLIMNVRKANPWVLSIPEV